MIRKQNNKKLARALSLLLVAVMLLCSCTNVGNGDVTTSTADNEGEFIDNSSIISFQIVCPDRYSETEEKLSQVLQNKIIELAGVTLTLTTDFVREGTEYVEKEYEILLGDTNRDASATAKEQTDKLNDWCIYGNGKKIAMYGRSDEALEVAVNEFIAKYLVDSVNIPTSLKQVYDAEYQIESLNVLGKYIKEYSIISENEDSSSVMALVDAVEKYVGYTLPVTNKSKDVSKEILLDIANIKACEELSADLAINQVAYKCADGSIIFAAGDYCSDLSGAVVSFINDKIISASGYATIENMDAVTFDIDQISVATAEYMASLQLTADSFKDKLLNNTTDYSSAKRVVYVSPNGSDLNNGTSPETPWKTLTKANSAPSGTVVLIECGSMWRGTYYPATGLTYSHYGDISKGLPIFNGSRQNYADPSLWVQTQYENVWECTLKFNNVGIIAFDHDYTVGDYDALVGKMLFDKSQPSLNQKDLNEDLEFYCNTSLSGQRVDTLYIYSAQGNPGTRFTSIEIGENESCIGLKDNVVIDGVRVMYSGGIAVGSGSVSGVTVKNCILEWIGGSKLSSDSTYGNAIQVFGSAVDCTFENNWCYQIYDCGITIQHTESGAEKVIMKNTSISNNLLEYCYWGIEYWNQKSSTHETKFENIRIEGNHIRFTGYGWGGVALRRDWYASESLATQSSAICCFGLTPNAKDVFIRNNIMELGYCNLIRMDYYGGEDNDHEGNTYIQYVGYNLCRLYGEQYDCGKTSSYDVSERLNDKTYTLVIVEGGEYEKKLLNK